MRRVEIVNNVRGEKFLGEMEWFINQLYYYFNERIRYAPVAIAHLRKPFSTEKTFSIFLCEIGKNRNEIYKRRYYIDSVFIFSDNPNNFAANNSLNSPIFFIFFLL